LSESNYKKLRKQLEEKGFAGPITVWDDGKKINVLKGHQRLRVLQKMKEEGVKVPDVPCAFVNCKDKKEAKRLVLSLASQYGSVTKQGLYEFQTNAKMDIEEIKTEYNFPEIDFRNYECDYFKEFHPYLPPKEDGASNTITEAYREADNAGRSVPDDEKFPLAIVVTKKVKALFESFKAENGFRSDTEAFIELLGNYDG